jgi:hypothetical protein
MLSIGRLWRRAPAWRLLLFISVACTALAAMFPPAPPPALLNFLQAARHPGHLTPASQDGAARFVPVTDPAPPDYAVTEQPPLGSPRSGVIPFAGRTLPLPTGGWQSLMLGRAPGPPAMQIEIFGRIVGSAVTGLIFATAPDAFAQGLPPALLLQACNTAGAIASQITPANPGDPLATECWTLGHAKLAMPGQPAAAGEVPMSRLDRLTRLGMTVPRQMLAFRYSRSDRNGWLGMMVLLPDRPLSSSEARVLQTWARRYALELHRGFDRDLPAGAAAIGEKSP